MLSVTSEKHENSCAPASPLGSALRDLRGVGHFLVLRVILLARQGGLFLSLGPVFLPSLGPFTCISLYNFSLMSALPVGLSSVLDVCC